MGWDFSKVGATVILGPSNKKVRGPVPTPMNITAFSTTLEHIQWDDGFDMHCLVTRVHQREQVNYRVPDTYAHFPAPISKLRPCNIIH